MPKATIVSEIGDGEYVIQLEYDMVRAIQLKERNESRLEALIETIATLQGIVNTLTTAKNDAATNLDTVIDTEASATPSGQELSDASKGKINIAKKALLDAIKELDGAEAPLRSDQLLLVQYEKEIDEISTALSKYENPVPVEAWCVDHTLELEGEVGTIELQDETNSPQDQPTIIQPEGSIKDTKVVQPVISSGAMAIAYNLAAMPAFQKWKPVYRNGIISNINTTNNTADVSFSQTHEFSSVRGFRFNKAYSIFHDVKVFSIPVDYMDCHAEAFHDNDKVVVEFASTGVSRVGEVEPEYTGTVIGFVSNPFLCPLQIYLESGFLDLLSTGRCTEQAYLPATLHFDADTISYNGSLTRPMQLKTSLIPSDFTEDSPYFGVTPTDGQNSLAVGCLPSEQSAEITDFCGNTHTNGGYCGDILSKKQAQQVIPASMFSGKLRLFVQALYGSIDNTYEKSGNFDLQISYPEDTTGNYQPVVLKRGFQDSSILYTTENFDYFLFVYAGGQFTVYPLDLSQQGQIFRNHLLTSARLGDFDYVKRVEALILSTAKINTGTAAALPITGSTILGSPLDYGWHSNWKGDDLAVVTFFKDPAQPQYLSTLQKIKITETINTTTGAISFAIVNTPESIDQPWWPWTSGLNLFLYDEVIQSMIPVEYPAIIFGGFTGTFDAPVYCYYAFDENTGGSELQVVSIFMDIGLGVNESFTLLSGTRFSSPQAFQTRKIKTNVFGADAGDKGFKINGTLVDLRVENLSFEIDETYFPTRHSNRGWPFDIHGPISSLLYPTSTLWGAANGLSHGETKELEYPPGSGITRTASWAWRTKWVWMGIDSEFNGGDHGSSGQIFMQTLLGDCSNIVTGVSETTYSDSTHSHFIAETTSAFNGVYFPFGGQLEWFIDSAFLGKPTVQRIAGGPPDEAMVYVPSFFGAATVILNEQTPPFPNTTAIECNEYHGGSKNPVVVTDEIILNEYFAPTISDKPTHTIDTSRNSIGNKYKIDHAAFTEDGDFIKDSSIGWS